MALRLYNTLTKKKELFEPVEPGKVGIYLCGPTVYKDSHIGHAVGPVIFDAFKKYLAYKGYQVKLIINITDVDDKIIKEANQQNLEISDLAQQVSNGYFEAMQELGVNSVDEFPRATDHIENIINLIQRLGERDAAYVADGDVYFDISKCADYGKLSHRKATEQLEGTRELAATSKRHHADFALWKSAQDDELGWDSPWGRGRPGWHIECSAMSMAYLGETFDIHGGGVDLVFPHHENEIAQSETATGKNFAKYWMHNGLTRIKTKLSSGEWQQEKMSKSLGNIKSIKELLTEYPGPVIRFFLLSTHYRRPLDFSDEAIKAVQKGLTGIYRLLERVARLSSQDVYDTPCNVIQLEKIAQTETSRRLKDEFVQGQLRYLEALDDDFNTPSAFAVLFDLCNALNRHIDTQRLELHKDQDAMGTVVEGARMIVSLGQVLGLLEGPLETTANTNELTGQLMQVLIEIRNEARQAKNFALADAIRDKLKAVNVLMEDRPDGTVWQRESS